MLEEDLDFIEKSVIYNTYYAQLELTFWFGVAEVASRYSVPHFLVYENNTRSQYILFQAGFEFSRFRKIIIG